MTSEKKIVVPAGMLEAANLAMGEFYLKPSEERQGTIEPILKGALCWLSENPLRPTGRQIQEMSFSMTAAGNSYQSAEDYCEEWQRRMFLSTEPPFEELMNLMTVEVNRVGGVVNATEILRESQRQKPSPEFDSTLGGQLMGRTFTPSQAEEIINLVRTSTHPQSVPKCRHCGINDAGGFFDNTLCGPCWNKGVR